MTNPHRPQSHFLPPKGWMNDPNGLIALEHDGKITYHLFYQHNPFEARWNQLCWGHASSTDLIHWHHHPIALEPSPNGPDATGCWSGCTIMHNGQPVIVYTASLDYNPADDSSRPSIALAFGDERLEHWQKFKGNPVLEPPAFDWVGFRDPVVWRDGERFLMTVGAGIRGRGGSVQLYESSDLEHWHELGPILVADELGFPPLEGQPHYGTVWECPQLVRLADADALLYCGWENRRGLYSGVFTGTLQDHRFEPQHSQYLDPGEFFAPQAMQDPQGRWIVFGWLLETRDQAAQLESGWSGVMSFPRVLTIENGQLVQHPAPELEALRGEHHAWHALEVGSDPLELGSFGSGFELRLRTDLARDEHITVHLGDDAQVVCSNNRFSVTTNAGERSLGLPRTETLEVRVFFDASVLEVFAHGRAITRRVYPEHTPSIRLRASQPATLELDVWRLKPVW